MALGAVLSGVTITSAAASGSWILLPMPSIASAYHWLTGVSCSSPPKACTTVGFYENRSGAFVALAERGNGSTWAIQPDATPVGSPSSTLNGVSCPSANSCVAVGEYQNASSSEVTFAERWNGSTWADLHAPNPPGAKFSWLSGVSCTSAISCTVVGGFDGSSLIDQTLAEYWDGTSWKIMPSPSAPGVNDDLLGISCTSTGCLAVGYSATVTLGQPLAMRWDGLAWSLETPPLPGGITVGRLLGVSCPPAAACTAVGWYMNNSGVTLPLAVGSARSRSWAIQNIPNPFGGLQAVSCISASVCTAVGNYQIGSGHWRTLAEIWNGSYWVGELPQNMPGATDSEVAGVSCLSAAVCIAAGAYDPTIAGGGTLAERSV